MKKEVTSLTAVDVFLYCPYCNERQDGFCGNPQGGEFECDDCGEEYKVHNCADVDFE